MLFRAENTELLHNIIQNNNIQAEWLNENIVSVSSEQIIDDVFACTIISDILKDTATPFYFMEFMPNKPEAYAEFINSSGGTIKETFNKDGLTCLLGKTIKKGDMYCFYEFAEYIGNERKLCPIPDRRGEIIDIMENTAKYLFETNKFIFTMIRKQKKNCCKQIDL